MYLESYKKVECCGCSACENICPKNTIKMAKDSEGFVYPRIINDNECIHCNLCKRVCPMIGGTNVQNKPKCYVGWLEDIKLRRLSTSGGAFSAIAEVAYKNGYAFFYGATYDGNSVVKHKGVTYDTIAELRGTKYLQSEMGRCYAEIKKILSNGNSVMFVGTPCQVAGLQSYVGEIRSNLLTISLVCHGVASPRVFEKYCLEMKSKQHGEVERVVFRDKFELHHQKVTSGTTIVFKDGYKASGVMNPYTTAFGLGLMHRPSCFACPYTTIYRDSDLTIGDFWGIEDYQPQFTAEIQNGISLILAHSKKGESIVSQLKGFFYEEVPVEWAYNKKQPQLSAPHKINPRRDSFMKKVIDEDQLFIKAAQFEILRWRIEKKIKGIVGKWFH